MSFQTIPKHTQLKHMSCARVLLQWTGGLQNLYAVLRELEEIHVASKFQLAETQEATATGEWLQIFNIDLFAQSFPCTLHKHVHG
jgi:hypothetical protein